MAIIGTEDDETYSGFVVSDGDTVALVELAPTASQYHLELPIVPSSTP